MAAPKSPQAASSPYITEAGYQTLNAELKDIWLRRAEVVKALADAAAEGDRSENAEYIYRKKELGEIDRRIRYLQTRLPELKVVRQAPAGERVFFGAWVRLKRDDGTEVEYRIVGADETDAAKRYISIDSPLARALLKKTVDDEIELTLEHSQKHFVVTGIRYD